MVQFTILSGKMAGSYCTARHFPFRVGRSASADLQIEDVGVWDEHLSLSLLPETAIEMTVQPGAMATINGESVNRATLRNGDLIQIGAVQLRFTISATKQKRFWGREALVWTGLGLVCLVQIGIIYWLMN